MAKIAVFDAKEIAEKLTLLNQYCDIEIAEDATFGDFANFLDRCSLDKDGNIWFTEICATYVRKQIINAVPFGKLVIGGKNGI